MRTSEIIGENRKFFFETYMDKMAGWPQGIFAFCVFLSGYVIWSLKNFVIGICFFRQAAYEEIDVEVMDYVYDQIGNRRFDSYTLVIVLYTVLLLSIMLIVWICTKNYVIYKKRKLLTFFPAVFFILEIGCIWILLVQDSRINLELLTNQERIVSFLVPVFKFFAELFNGRMLMTVFELRKSKSMVLRFVDWLADYIIEKL